MTPTEAAEIRELADAAAGIRRYATGDYLGNRAYATAVERYERALLMPGVVAARGCTPEPAVEDPRDATIRDLRALLERCATALERLGIEQCACCEGTGRAVGVPSRCFDCHGTGLVSIPKDDLGLAFAVETLAALRSAGVEPTPSTPEVLRHE